METVQIPHYIDNYVQLAFWEADEIGPVMFLVAIGMVTQTLTWCLLISYGVHKIYMHYKEQHLRGYLLHLLYRAGILPLNSRFSNGAILHYNV